jgi:hypothetical protein
VPLTKRRNQPRTEGESRTTAVIQSIIRDPHNAVAVILAELQAGTPAPVMTGLLDSAQKFAALRGVDIQGEVVLIRRRIHEGGYAI